ncbi:MAG: MFS transporter [Thermodesulfobacteriota bacterium]
MASVTPLTGYQKFITFGGRFHYAWVVAIAGGMATLIGAEPLALFGVFLEPIAKDLGVGRGAVSAVYWIAFCCMGISSIASGWAADNIGIRRTLIIATIGTMIPLMLLAQARHLWQLYLWYGVVFGLARSGFTTPMLITITLWFKKKQGLAVGIVSSGLAVGPMVFAPLFRHLINIYGWGHAFLILGVFSGLILAPCCFVIRNRPSDLGVQPYGEEETEKTPVRKPVPAHRPIFYRTDVPNFFRYAMTTQPFFLLPLIHFLGCVSHAIPLAHVVVMATDRGIDPIAASTVLGIAIGISATSRLTAPMLADKIGGRKALVLFILMQGISILWLMQAKELWLFYLFSLFFGLAYGGEMTPFPILNRQYYGTAPIGMIYGFQVMVACLGMGIGGFIGGVLYDQMGNYALAIWVSALTGFAGAGLSYLLIDPFTPLERSGIRATPSQDR